MFTVLTIIAWSFLGIQLIYLIVFLVAFYRKRDGVVKDTNSGGEASELAVPVSIIVCAHDEEENLRELIPLLFRQQYSNFEVIVVEDRCNDGTFDFLLSATQSEARLKMVRVRHLPEHLNGKKFALTLGIKAATYDWVLLTDADCRPASDQWIRSMTSHFREGREIVIGYSPYSKLPSYLNAFVRFESLITGIQYIGLALLGGAYMGVGRNLAYRKNLFFSNKGFNKHLAVTGGDDDLFVNEHATRSNTAVNIGSDSLVFSNPKKTWREFLYQKLRHLAVGKHYKSSDKFVLGLFSATWMLNWLFVLPLIFFVPPVPTFLWGGFLCREVLLVWLVRRSSRVMGDSFEAWKTPFLDFNYAIYYLGTGLAALASKRVRWKK
ncbi:glycosyltransferase [soil metagenome]